jgi:hypothetical protein
MNLWEIDWFERSNGVGACFTLLQQMMDQEHQRTNRGYSTIPSDYLFLVPANVYREMNERGHVDAIRTVLTEAITDYMKGHGYIIENRDLLLEFTPTDDTEFKCEALQKARLTCIVGREATDSYTDLRLNSTRVIIGRKPETSAITIPPSFNKLSREHLQFDCEPRSRSFLMTNLSERSVTEVNQKVVEPHVRIVLEDNSKIVIGADEHALMFHWTHQFVKLAA